MIALFPTHTQATTPLPRTNLISPLLPPPPTHPTIPPRTFPSPLLQLHPHHANLHSKPKLHFLPDLSPHPVPNTPSPTPFSFEHVHGRSGVPLGTCLPNPAVVRRQRVKTFANRPAGCRGAVLHFPGHLLNNRSNWEA